MTLREPHMYRIRANEPTEHPARHLGKKTIGSIALGTGLMALLNTPEEIAISTIHAALDAGVRAIDAAAVYTPHVDAVGYSDRLVARAIASWDGPNEDVVHISKGGHRRIGNGLRPDDFIIDGRPESVRRDAETSLKAMNAEVIDLYLLHMPDPGVPLVESFGALVELKREGKVRMIGLSNVDALQLEEASREGVIDAVENQYSVLPSQFQPNWPMTREDSREVLLWCEARSATFFGYSPLGGGEHAANLGAKFPALQAIAAQRGATPQQVALAWLLHQNNNLVSIVGCRRVTSAVDSAAAMHLWLEDSELQRIQNELNPGTDGVSH